jgi:chorismate mutase/prephenate dehydratase
LEAELRIAFFGAEASFTHIASRRQFGSSAIYVARPTQADVFREVERGDCLYGVVPIENSTNGVVIESLDLFARSSLRILGEILLPVAHNLLSNSPMEAIERVYSHPQALAQCREWLNAHLPRVEKFEISSTSEAARRVAQESGSAAIASELAAEKYGVNILHTHIEDSIENVTRFFVIGPHAAEPTGNDKTTLLFSIRDEVGSLVRVLERFSKYGIDLTNLVSRPSRIRSWEYLFFADVSGHVKDASLEAALAEVEQVCLYLKVLGSYPCG